MSIFSNKPNLLVCKLAAVQSLITRLWLQMVEHVKKVFRSMWKIFQRAVIF